MRLEKSLLPGSSIPTWKSMNFRFLIPGIFPIFWNPTKPGTPFLKPRWRPLVSCTGGFRAGIPMATRFRRFYIYPLYNIKDPMAPPQLRPPLQRRPAEKGKKGASLFRHLVNWLIPSAHAEEAPSPQTVNTRKTVIFSWYEVPDADYYVIEISVSKDFLSPMVVKKVSKN